MLRVLVVDDSAVFRRLLTRVIDGDRDLTVVGQAANGLEAIELANQLRPDVITMDMHMPRMNGLEATRRIMQEAPRPIVIISASVDPRDVADSFQSIDAGAVALLAKPPSPVDPGFGAAIEQIVKTLKLMSEVKVVKRRKRPDPRSVPAAPLDVPLPAGGIDVIAIGTSTGGPAALAQVLGALPSSLPVPVGIVQHIAEGFDVGLARWLNAVSPLNVVIAAPGMQPGAGDVVIAPSGMHLGLTRRGVVLSDGEPLDGHLPSVTHLFSSVARSFGSRALGVVLTGMGGDGARGLLELKRAGGKVLAQDEATSIVYGMAKRAVELGAVDRVLPLDGIPAAIVEVCSGRSATSARDSKV